MRHRLFTVLSALPLLLCVAECALGMSGHHSFSSQPWAEPWGDRFAFSAESFDWSCAAKVYLPRRRVVGPPARVIYVKRHTATEGGSMHEYRNEPAVSAWEQQFEGFYWRKWGFLLSDDPIFKQEGGTEIGGQSMPNGDIEVLGTEPNDVFFARYWSVEVPCWALTAGAAILPVLWVVTFVRRRRKRAASPTACAACGYDIRATPHRCPECGTRVNRRQIRKLPVPPIV